MADGITSDVEIRSIRAVTLAFGLPSQVLDTGDMFDSGSDSSFEIISISSSLNSRSSSFDDQSDAELSSNSLSDKAVDALCRKIYKSRHSIEDDIIEIEINIKEVHSSFNTVEDVINDVVDSVSFVHDKLKQSVVDNDFSNDLADENDGYHDPVDNIDSSDKNNCIRIESDELLNNAIANSNESTYQSLHTDDYEDDSNEETNSENVVTYASEYDEELVIKEDEKEMVHVQEVSDDINKVLCEKIPDDYYEEESLIGNESSRVKGVIIEDERNMSFDSSDEYNFSVMDTIVELSENSNENSIKSYESIESAGDIASQEQIMDHFDNESNSDIRFYLKRNPAVFITDFDRCKINDEGESVDFRVEAASHKLEFCDNLNDDSVDELISNLELDEKEENSNVEPHFPQNVTDILEAETPPRSFRHVDNNSTFNDGLSASSRDSEFSEELPNDIARDVLLTNGDNCFSTKLIMNDETLCTQDVFDEPIIDPIVDQCLESAPCEEETNHSTVEIFARAGKHLFLDDESDDGDVVMISASPCIDNDMNVSPVSSPITLSSNESHVKRSLFVESFDSFTEKKNVSIEIDGLYGTFDSSHERGVSDSSIDYENISHQLTRRTFVRKNVNDFSLDSYEDILDDGIHDKMNTLDDSPFNTMHSRINDSVERINILQEIFHGVEDKFTKAVDEILDEEFNKLDIEESKFEMTPEVPIVTHCVENAEYIEDDTSEESLLSNKQCSGKILEENKLFVDRDESEPDLSVLSSDESISGFSLNDGNRSFFNVSREDLLGNCGSIDVDVRGEDHETNDNILDINDYDEIYSDKDENEENISVDEEESLFKDEDNKTVIFKETDNVMGDIAAKYIDIADDNVNEENNSVKEYNMNDNVEKDFINSEYKEDEILPKNDIKEIDGENDDEINVDVDDTIQLICTDTSSDTDENDHLNGNIFNDTASITSDSPLVSSCGTEFFLPDTDEQLKSEKEEFSNIFDKSSCVLISFGEKHSVYVAAQPYKRLAGGD